MCINGLLKVKVSIWINLSGVSYLDESRKIARADEIKNTTEKSLNSNVAFKKSKSMDICQLAFFKCIIYRKTSS